MPVFHIVAPWPVALGALLRKLQEDAEAGRFKAAEEYRVPRNEGGIGDRHQRAFGDDYADLGDGCYRHLSSTNSDGESYEEADL